MPRPFSSGALSIWSKATNCTFGLCFASTFVIAAVSVVFPWSTCPIVPMFTCGLERSNFSFDMCFSPCPRRQCDLRYSELCTLCFVLCFPAALFKVPSTKYQALKRAQTVLGSVPVSSLLCDPLDPRDNLLRNILRRSIITLEVHR